MFERGDLLLVRSRSPTSPRPSAGRCWRSPDQTASAGGAGRWSSRVWEGLSLGTGGLILMLALAIPAFRETAELAVTFLDRYGNEIGDHFQYDA